MAESTLPAPVPLRPAIAGTPRAARPSNTLRRMLAFRTALLLLDAVLLVVLLATGQGIRDATHRLASEQVPGLIEAQEIDSALSAMDAAFVAQRLSGSSREAELGELYNTDRTAVVRGLIGGAQHLSASGAEAQPLEALEGGLGEYERLLQRSRDLAEREPDLALPVYRQAAGVLDTQLLPAANSLTHLSVTTLDGAASAQSLHYTAFTAARVLTGLTLLSLLVLGQLFLSRRTHRLLNLPLLAGTLLFVVGGIHLAILLARAEDRLLQARTQALTLTEQVLTARSAALAADDQETRSLLDRAHALAAEHAFALESSRVATLPASLPGEPLLAALREGREVEGFSGALASVVHDADNNHERSAALAAVLAWQHYLSTAGQVFQLEHSGQIREALQIGIGTAPNALPQRRAEFLRTLDRLLEERRLELTTHLGEAERTLRATTLESCLGLPLLALLIVLGFAPRLREYQAR